MRSQVCSMLACSLMDNHERGHVCFANAEKILEEAVQIVDRLTTQRPPASAVNNSACRTRATMRCRCRNRGLRS